jgi:alpha-mannosidase
VSSVKTAEDSDGKDMIIRLYDANGNGAAASLKFTTDISKAEIVDINEITVKALAVSGNEIKVDVPKFEVITIKVSK